MPGMPAILREELLGFILLYLVPCVPWDSKPLPAPPPAARSGTARRRAPIASRRVARATRKRFGGGGGGKAARAAGFVCGWTRRGGSYAPPAGASARRPTIGPMAFNFSATAGAGAANPTGAFGGFGTTTTSAAPAFSFSAPTNTGTGGLFGGTQNKGFGFGTSFGTGTGTGLGSGLGTGLGFGGFGTQQQQQQQQTTLGTGLFNQPAQTPAQSNQLINTASALSAPTLLGDERDAILAKWNQLQAFWGTGKGYFNNNIAPVEFTQENPFCRFKAVGYSLMPNNKDEDGLVVLVFNRKEADIRSQQQQLVESLHKILGGNQTLTVNVEGVKTMPDDQTEVIIYIVERSPNGTSRRVPATTLYAHFEQANIKSSLQQLGVSLSMARTELSPAQVKQLLQNPPAGVDPIIWEQAKVDNPDPDKLIPVPMVGFKELLRRLKVQDQMTKQHQTRLDIISEDISELQKNQTTTMAKIAQYKRKLMALSHRTLQVLIKQEIQRKSGYAIQADEEQLRVQLDTIQCELNAPTQFKGRLNELMSQIRMQNHFGAVRAEERYYIDADLLREIKQHLKQQQEGLSHLISIIKDDLEDIKLIEHGLNESIPIRGGVFS
ncbi:nucleoporin p54 isoform X2 [Motacilla alba alba]|uniref:nucleoporin p54 isoform X2 n=1 Tax=Motacilla alba alba TaxID=1094192 RepID=UPI0018D561DB|nr:nucleoporin p54 isoform X2 [Motacilla alba alba]